MSRARHALSTLAGAKQPSRHAPILSAGFQDTGDRMIRRPRSCVGSEPSLRKTPAGQRARVAAFLHFTDSRSKFRIEGENPLRDRVRRLGKSSARQGAALSTEPSLNVRSASRLATRALFVWGCARSTVSSATKSQFSAFRFQIVSVLGRKISRPSRGTGTL